MYMNFWYPLCTSAELGTTPLTVTALGLDFVVFRDSEGRAACLADTCIHRGGALSAGKVVADCIECPYHGWRFDTDGRCVRIPSLGRDAPVPGRARVDSYPVVERYGLVFGFLGDLPEAERPPIMEIREWDGDRAREGWRQTIQLFDFPLNYQRSVENGLDFAHNEFVHPTHGFSYQNEDSYAVPPLELREGPWGVGSTNRMFAPPLADPKMREASGRTSENSFVTVDLGHVGPASIWTYIHPTETFHIHQYLYERPVNRDRTLIYFVTLRNFLLEPEGDERMITRNAHVVHQDRDVLARLRPAVTPDVTRHEFLVPADLPVVRYRQFLSEWEQRGWRVDLDAIERDRHRQVYAIPSPARREQKGWVLDPVPLLRPGS
jgi:phenylpropionate dioxygenase-like ring-hydroxylating dioxygenase large terminal subunit